MNCPTCRITLNAVKVDGTPMYRCKKCNGKALTIYSFKKHLRADIREHVTQWKVEAVREIRRPCPSCNSKMLPIPLKLNAKSLQTNIDICKSCNFFWFDHGKPVISVPPIMF